MSSGKGIKPRINRYTRTQVLDLMVNFYLETERVFSPGWCYPFSGTAEEILNELERVIQERWIRQSSYEQQLAELQSALHRIEQYRALLGDSGKIAIKNSDNS
ncbi:MAG TPA: hypothetical protein VF412_06305 [Bdellovibrio sp.]|uniref:hypothetical protein n=1 Tax=Bdellovibrio sp. TaxID=28201 RepID=UPI002EFD0293